ncbi:MAG: flippase [Bacteroidaceae bacterium]|nr:flippase [Bacteroidaceae bacterium]
MLGVLIVGIFVARYLGEEQYGLMNYVMSYVAIFQVLADFGLDNIQIREEAKDISKKDVLIGTTLILKLMFALAAITLIAITTFIFESDSTTQWLVMLYSSSVILNTTWVFRNHFTSIVWNEYIVKTEISRTIIGALVKVLLLYTHASLTWFVASLVFDAMLLASGYTLSYSRKVSSVTHCRFDKGIAKELVRQSFPLLLSGAAIVIYCKIDQVMIAKLLNNAQLGIYSVAIQFTNVLIFVPTIISQTIAPVLVRVRATDEQRYQMLASQFMDATIWICVIIAVVISLLSYPLVLLTFGAAYIHAAPILAVMAFKVIGDALSQTSGQLMIIEGIQKYASIRNCIGCLVCVILNLLLLERYGTIGAAFISIITIVSSGFLANLLIPRYRHIFLLQAKTLCIGWVRVWKIRFVNNQ